MQVDISLTTHVESTWFQLLESTVPFNPLVSRVKLRHYNKGSVYQGLYWSISEDEGTTWGPPRLLMDDDQLPVWTPVLRTEGSRLWLVYTRSSRRCRYYDRSRGVLRHSPGGDLLYVTSDNSGRTWSSPQVILPYDAEGGIPKVVANKMVVLGGVVQARP